MNSLTILNREIQSIDGMFSLNDLHKASGALEKHQPSYFVRNQETKDLADEIMQSANLQSDQVIRKVNGGHNRGTYACKEIVYRYAMWISPKFALTVIRAFDALLTGELEVKNNINAYSTVKQRNGLIKLVNWAVKQLNIDYSEACNMVNYRFNTKNFTELTCEQVEHACEYMQGLILEYGKSYQPITQPQVMALPPAQNVSQGKFVGAFDEFGRMAMRQMHDDEFVTTMFDLPKLIQSDTETNLAVLSEINAAVSNRIAFLATTIHTYKRVGAA